MVGYSGVSSDCYSMKAKALTTIAAVTDNSAPDIPRLMLQSKLFDTGSDFSIGVHACSVWSAFFACAGSCS